MEGPAPPRQPPHRTPALDSIRTEETVPSSDAEGLRSLYEGWRLFWSAHVREVRPGCSLPKVCLEVLHRGNRDLLFRRGFLEKE